MTRTKAQRRRAAPRFELTDVERVLLEMYRTVPVDTRAQVGQTLFHKWTHPNDDAEAAEMQTRYKAAQRAFKTGELFISVFDDLCAGGFVRVEDAPPDLIPPELLRKLRRLAVIAPLSVRSIEMQVGILLQRYDAKGGA